MTLSIVFITIWKIRNTGHTDGVPNTALFPSPGKLWIMAPRVLFDGSSLRAKALRGMQAAAIGTQLLKPAWAVRQHRRKEISETSVESWLGFQCLVCFLPDYAKAPHVSWCCSFSPLLSKAPACSIP